MLVVLIVAKCNVNVHIVDYENEEETVLIVAKCNVNFIFSFNSCDIFSVLIVAKCNVNSKVLNSSFCRNKY